MKKNLMSLAIAATVATTATTAVNAAKYVSPEGTGEVILFPFYNADNGNATNMHLVNTTADVKALKVRFVEYKNSDEVLDFNLYLSPKDHFAFGVIKNPNGTGAAVITADNSCTVPALGGPNGDFSGSTTENADGSITRIQPFVNYQYANSKDVDSSIERTLTGHVEVIEMGVVYDATTATVKDGTALAASATHGPTGVPASCANLEAAWAAGVWAGTDIAAGESAGAGVTAPTGGVYGLSYHINVEDAAAFGIEPTALDDFATQVEHTNPGSLFPSLASGSTSAVVFTRNAATSAGAWKTVGFAGAAAAAQASSATLMTASLSNDVMINPALGGETDWVITFPTKRLHVDKATKLTVVDPFTDNWVGNDQGTTPKEKPACEVVNVKQWDREEAITSPTNGFSPSPAASTNKVCNEVAVYAMGTGAASALSVETGLKNLSFPYSEGWMRIAMAQTLATDSPSNGAITGLPAIGFAAYKVNNGAMSYGNTSEHKTDSVTSGI